MAAYMPVKRRIRRNRNTNKVQNLDVRWPKIVTCDAQLYGDRACRRTRDRRFRTLLCFVDPPRLLPPWSDPLRQAGASRTQPTSARPANKRRRRDVGDKEPGFSPSAASLRDVLRGLGPVAWSRGHGYIVKS